VSAPAATAVPGPGSVVFSDNFDDPSKPNFPVTTRDATERSQGYIDGQYEIINGTRSGGEGEGLPGTYSNSTIAIDAKVSGGPDTAGPYVSCRRANNDNEDYQLSVEPAHQRFRLYRYQGGGSANVTLVMQNSTAIRGKDEVNRLELTCAASTITAAINGTQVTSVQDATYTTGRHRFGVNGGGAVGRFDNLVVTLR